MMVENKQLLDLLSRVSKLLQQIIAKYELLAVVNDNILNMDKDLNELEKYIEERESLFDQLNNLSLLLVSFQKQLAELLKINENSWSVILAHLDTVEKESLQQGLDLLNGYITKILAQDKEVISFFERHKKSIQQELKSFLKHKEIQRAYLESADMYIEPQLIDKEK